MNRTSNRPRRRLSALVQEFVLIVAGVSVALSADSALETRREWMRETEYLEQLRSDLNENARRLESAIRLEEQQRAAAQTAFDAVDQKRSIPPDSAQAWLIERRGLFYSDPRLLSGTFSALTNTGDLRLIRDREVREAIIAYLPQIGADQAEFDRWVEQLLPHLERLTALGFATRPAQDSYPDPATRAVSASAPDPAVLVSLQGVLDTNESRLTYLTRMLESTRLLEARISRPD